MVQTSFKSLSLQMLLDLLAVSDSQIIIDTNNKVDAEEIEDKKNVVKILEKTIVARRAEFPPMK